MTWKWIYGLGHAILANFSKDELVAKLSQDPSVFVICGSDFVTKILLVYQVWNSLLTEINGRF